MPSPNIPAHHEMYADILGHLARVDQPIRNKELVEPLQVLYKLSDEEVAEMYESGNAPVFVDRIQWSLSYLNMADFMDKPKRGFYALSEEGRRFAGKSNEVVKTVVDKRFKARTLARQESSVERSVGSPAIAAEVVSDANVNPQEQLKASFAQLRGVLYEDILKTLGSKSPQAFEKVVVRLLGKMGYGDEIVDSGTVTQYSRDGGIDGVIKEDILGFGRIYIQAKRYAANHGIGSPAIREFVGALAGAGASKGVFITTSYFSRDAKDYATNLNTGVSLILIDGQQLAAYIYTYNLGMQTEETLEIKKLDADFWDELPEERG